MIKIRDLTFEYFDRDDEGNLTDMINAIRGINFDAQKGEIIAIAGRNGSGKSTLAKILNRLLVPVEGTVVIGGLDAMEEENTIPIRKKVGMVFQNPDNQLIGSVISEDVAFGAENLGVEQTKLWSRVLNAVSLAGLGVYLDGKKLKDKRINELSGGEKQKVAIAGVLAMQPECIVFDESTSMLDPASRRELLASIREVNEKLGITVILITHIMEELLFADTIYVMDMGRIVMKGRKNAILSKPDELEKYGLELPPISKMALELQKRGVIRTSACLSIEELANRIRTEHVAAFSGDGVLPAFDQRKKKVDPIQSIIFDHVSFGYGKTAVLKDVSCSIAKGEYVAIVGPTGAGKTTLLKMIPGLLAPKSGNVYVDGLDVNDKGTNKQKLRTKIGYVFQYPEQQLFAKNVYEDVVFGPRNVGISEVEAEKRAYESIELVGLSQEVYDMPMKKLSGGQRRRVALAGVLAMKPDYLILDEPTAGLDPKGRSEMLQIIDILHKEAGLTVVIISHDAELVAEHVDRVIAMDKLGDNKENIVADGTPEEVFYELSKLGGELPVATKLLIMLREMGLMIPCKIVKQEQAIEYIERAVGLHG